MRFCFRLSLILVCLICSVCWAMGQTNKNFFFQQSLTKALVEKGISKEDFQSFIITDQYLTKHNNLTHTYLQQTKNGIPIYGAKMSIATNAKSETIHIGNRFLNGLRNYTVAKAKNINEIDAIESASKHLNISFENDVKQISSQKFGNKFKAASISNEENISVREVLVPQGKDLILAFEVDLFSSELNEWWQIRIDASNGKFINKDAWTLICNFGHEDECLSDHVCSHNSKHNHHLKNNEHSQALVTNTYQVFAMPLSDPNDGGRTVETAPWSNANNASPFGWHDTDGVNGAEYTVTRGNNVRAVEDRDANNSGGASPDGGASLDFSFPMDLVNDDPIDYQDAAITNLFYWNNIIHDVLYEYGFDEVAGNFQENNYGNGGAQSDSVNADAQDGSGTNNANFSTPSDGNNPRMQMFEWNVSNNHTFNVTFPASISGSYQAAGANFGPSTGGATGSLVAATPAEACTAITNGSAISGKIAMIDRGNCTFVNKVLEAQSKGAIAVVVCNNVAGPPSTMGGSNASITIPSVMVSMADCNTFKANLPVNISFTLQPPDILDSDLDNTVIIHEYGHGVSNRLTGGPASSSCLGGDEQMGEGWSDYLGLMLTMKSGDVGTTGRGMGAYLVDEPSTANGIRSYPYSTDLTVNPLTYDDIMTESIPHGVGAVWASMLWDMTWLFIAQDGFDTDFYHGTGGNNKALQLVLDGMKLQPCNPGFIDGRDAIIAADLANNGGANECLIWEAFAKRGLGFSATQGSSGSVTDGVEAFDIPGSCQNTLIFEKTGNEITTTQGSINYTLSATNNYQTQLTNLQIIDPIPSGVDFVIGSLINGSFASNTVTVSQNLVLPGEGVLSSFIVTPDLSDSSELFLIEDIEITPSSWSSTSGQGIGIFTPTTTNVFRGINSLFVPNLPADNTQYYTSPTISLPPNAMISFQHSYDTEPSYDGGYIQISTDGGSTFNDLSRDDFLSHPYNSTLGASSNSDIANKEAFSGNSLGYVKSIIDLNNYSNTNVVLRFVFGSDNNTNNVGWYIDDILIYDAFFVENEACLTTDQGDNICDTLKTLLLPSCENYLRFYQDLDGDGFGNDAVEIIECFAPMGYVSQAGDCDDNNMNMYPGNTPDICDGLDNDCDGVIDEDCGALICDGATVYVNIITQNEYHARDYLESDVIIVNGQMIEFTAGDEILLDNGFEVEANVDFEAKIEDCDILLVPDLEEEGKK